MTGTQNRVSHDSFFDELIARVRGFIASSLAGPDRETPAAASSAEDFENLALHLFRLQFEHVPVYRRYCKAKGASEKTVSPWHEIPALPARAFKEFEVTSLPVEDRSAVFHSSGTTGRESSRHFHNAASLGLYESSLLAWFSRCVLDANDADSPARDLPLIGSGPVQKRRFVILTPDAKQAPHSSLVHMFETLQRVYGDQDSMFACGVDSDGGWEVNLPSAVSCLENAVKESAPVMVLGTAFSYVRLFDELRNRNRRFQMPAGAKVLETGGYKGRSRTLAKEELHSLIEAYLGVSEAGIVSEYGMSELSSQAYKRGGVFKFPPWARARLVSPETGGEVGEGETGLIRVFDLANIRSVMAVQTEDLGVRRGGAFELIGRAGTAEARGCSFMAV